MQIQKINNILIAKSQTANSDTQKTSHGPITNFNIMSDTVAFKAQTLMPNQVLPATEKLIQRAVRQTKIEKNKIIAALNKTWKSFAMGKVSNIYMGHKELPLDNYQMEWLHQSIQLTGDIPGHERVYFSECEPHRFLIHIDPIKEPLNPKEHVIFDIDYRTSDKGIITEFSPNMCEVTTDPTKIQQLNERVQYCLKALFPKKAPKTTPK